MAAKEDLKVWANTVSIDPIENTPNILEIPDDLWNNGWLRENPVNAQHINKLLNLVTGSIKNETLTPSLNLSDVSSAATSRVNLDVPRTSDVLLKSGNLSGLASTTTARSNLDVPKTSDTLLKSGNLSGLANVSTARDNLGLNTDTLFNTFFDKVYPVGTIYENKTNTANPNTYLGRGTWVADGQGRVSIGSGSGTDSRGETVNFPSGSSGGEYKHVMLQSELVPHQHATNWDMYDEAGTESNKMASGAGTAEVSQFTLATNNSTGAGDPFNITQTYVVYNRWLRTA